MKHCTIRSPVLEIEEKYKWSHAIKKKHLTFVTILPIARERLIKGTLMQT